MIAEIIPQAYDAMGRQVARPFDHRRGFHPSFPMGRYVGQPLSIECASIKDIRAFLANCLYVSDKELFGKEDYWQPPDEFEKKRKGDCEDFALWTWRQLLHLGYDARFVGGSYGIYGRGHAWVEYFQDGKCYLVEPLRSRIVSTMPRLSTIKYVPKVSVSWDGKTLRYFSHKKPGSPLGPRLLTLLLLDYIIFWAFFWVLNFYRLPSYAWRILGRNLFRRELWWQRKAGRR
jgi:Bacterial transglutaminase-like cysteine proteinase BTLCP